MSPPRFSARHHACLHPCAARIQLVALPVMHAVDEERGALVGNPNLTFKHDYPATKLMFIPVWGCVAGVFGEA